MSESRTIHKRDYFLKAMANGSFRYKRWVIEAFSVSDLSEDDPAPYPLQLLRDANWRYYFRDPAEPGVTYYLEGTYKDEPAFAFTEEIVLGVGDLPNVKRNITTTYGNTLFNQIAIVYPFHDKIEFLEGRISIPQVEKIIEARLQDDPVGDGKSDPQAIYVSEFKKFCEAALSLAGYTQLCVPSATPRTMTTDPNIAARRDELLKQYKDRLHDPVVQAKIDAELIAMDRAYLKGDPGERFYIKAKSYDVVRKKSFLMQGAEQGFDVQGDVIPTSLNEGWDVKHLSAMGNSLREGSYNRGALTALGGEATKFNYRIFQNTVIAEEDCGSTLGMRVLLTEERAPRYLSSSIVQSDGLVELTEDNLSKYIGKVVFVRSPIYCRTKGANFCATCMGKRIASTPNAISTYAADIGSIFMGIMLKSMHGKSLSVAKYDLKTAIS